MKARVDGLRAGRTSRSNGRPVGPSSALGPSKVTLPGRLLDIQRSAGNRATASRATLLLPPPPGRVGGDTPARPPRARWRLPSHGDLQSLLSGGTVDEAVVHSRVRRLLGRMAREGRHRLGASVDLDTIMAEIFPSPGTIDQAAYERYLDPSDRTMVYESVHDAMTEPSAADRPDLQRAMRAAAATAETAAGDEAGLRAVFGDTEWSNASTNYRLIRDRLRAVAANIADRVTTDYNLDAQETFLGGWADFGSQHMHLLSDVVTDPLTVESKATLLHEGAHLAASNIDDHVYYGTTGFEAAPHGVKVDNAAHYEELPRRIWGNSRYAGQTFVPGRSSGGAPLTTEQRIRAAGAEYYRQAWDAAADLDDLAKSARREQLNAGNLDAAVRDRLLEVSPLMDLTFHEQFSSPLTVTRLDVTTTESIVRGVGIAGDLVETVSATTPGPHQSTATEIAAGTRLVIDRAMAAYGGLLGDANRDRQLLAWLHGHYRNVFP